MRPGALARASTIALALLLCYGILTLWVPQRWALALYQAGAFLLAARWMIRFAARPFRLEGSLALAPLLGIVALALAQLASRSTIDPWQTWNAALEWSANAALFFSSLQSCAEPALRRRFLDGLLYFGLGLSVLSTVQMFTAGGAIFWIFPSGYSDLVLGPFVYKNQYAAFIEMVLPLALYRALRAKDRRALRYWGMAAIMVASVVAGASRAGSLLVLLEVVAVPLLAVRQGVISARRAGLALAQFVLLSVAATAIVGWGFLWERFQQAEPYAVRREILQSSVAMILDRPWTGFGLGTWSTAYPQYALYDDGLFANQAHNDWAQWAVEGGVPLFLLMLAFAALVARPASRSLWGVGLIAVLIHCLVDYPMQQRPALAGWFFAMAGALAAVGAGRGKTASDLVREDML
jgi:O-antigen ligase